MSKKQGNPLYSTWQSMITRCYNVSAPSYFNYGGKGVSVCEEWRNSFHQFERDMGHKPTSEHSLDRIDPYGDYEPSNCRWADKETQANNKRKDKICYIGKQNDLERACVYDEMFLRSKNKIKKIVLRDADGKLQEKVSHDVKIKLKQYMYTFYGSQKAFAEAFSIDCSHLSNILNGKSSAGYATAYKIEKATNGEVTCRDLMK